MKKVKRVLSLVLCGVLLLGNFPAMSFAAEGSKLCEHHTVHENCGYVAAVAGTDCRHEHDDSCFTVKCIHMHGDCGYTAAVEGVECDHRHDENCGYAEAEEEVPCSCQQEEHTEDCAYAPAIPERECAHIHGECSFVEAKSEVPCGHDCSLDEACGEKVLSCTHVHDESCGYVAAVEGKTCEFVCETCAAEEASAAAVAEVKALMDDLPALEAVQAMSMEDQKAAYEQTQAAYEAYGKLTAEQQKELTAPEEVFKPLFEYFNTLINADGEIGSGTPDGTPPVLKGLTLSATSVTIPGTIDVVVDASDDVSGLDYSTVVFHCEETGKILGCSLTPYSGFDYTTDPATPIRFSDGKLRGTIEIDQYVEAGTFKIRSIHVYDGAGNDVAYSTYEIDDPLPDSVATIQFSVIESETPDGTPPVLNGITLSTITVNAPGTIDVVVDASDDVSGLDYSTVVFHCEETGKILGCSLTPYSGFDYTTDPAIPIRFSDGKLRGTIEIDQYVEAGTFKIRSVHVYDGAGNDVTYSTYEIDDPLPESVASIQFSVRNTGADVTTSVSKSTFVEEIANAEDDAYIAADYSGNATMPKEAFDAIAGTDKTIDLISEGITWRFEGSDITEETKDIDLKVEIQKVEDDSSASGEAIEGSLNGNPGVVMKFPENGTLPGKATIQVKVDYAMRKYLGSDTGLSVYYYNNQTGELELIASNLKVINDTYVEFPITHCSYYVLTNPNGSNGGSTAQGIAVDKTNFPDENFRTWILEQDYGKDGVLTQDELSAVTMMDVTNQEILDLTGIEHFTALTALVCVDNKISVLDISKNTALNYLDCGGNLLTSLDVSNNTGLEYLMCDSNQITALDLQNNIALKNLNCNNNSLTALEVSHLVYLTSLGCDNNQLKELDVSKNTKLDHLGCRMNQLTKLDVSNNTVLRILACSGNQLSVLDVSKNTALEQIICFNNQLTCLDVSKNAVLKNLSCGKNQLTVLDVSSNTALCYLYFDSNKITSLDVSKNTALEQINCSNNQLTSLDLSRNPNCNDVNAAKNVRQITLDDQNAFDLSTLPGFDVNKASQWTGATVDNQTLTAKRKTITYSYQVDSGKSVKFTLQANNYDPNAGKMEGTWGNLTWKVDEAGTLTLFGTGGMIHYQDPNAPWDPTNPLFDGYPWHRYADLIQSVVVEEGVTSLAEIAFHGLDNLQSVTLPDSLTAIGDAAFIYCPCLESIVIPENVSAIGKDVFIGSEHFREITFTGNAPSFDSAAFGGITAEAYYPCDNDTWTTEVQQNYGGDITWVGHVFGQWITEGNTSSRTCTRCGYTEHKVSTDSGDVEVEIPEQPELEVEVDPVLPSENDYVLVEETFDKADNRDLVVLKVFDINLKNANGVHVQPNGTVKVKLPLDWEKDGNYKVYRVNANKTLTDMNAYRQGSHMVFETDHFSIYVIAEERVVTAPAAKTLTYTGSAQALVNAGSVTGGTMQYSLDGVTYSASVPTATNAGTYTVYYKVEGSQAAAQTVSVTIAKAKVTITADNKVAAVGTAKPTLTYTVTGLKGSDKLTSNPTLTCNPTMSAVGEYEITVTGGDAGANYEIQRVNGKLSVKKEHKVYVAAVTNGTVSVSHEKAIEGTEIAITATPKSGYHFSTLTVKDAAGTSYVVSTDNNGKYYFIMPDVDVTVTVSFSKNVTADPTNPKTGDGFAVVLWSGIMITSMLCMTAIIFGRKRYR